MRVVVELVLVEDAIALLEDWLGYADRLVVVDELVVMLMPYELRVVVGCDDDEVIIEVDDDVIVVET